MCMNLVRMALASPREKPGAEVKDLYKPPLFFCTSCSVYSFENLGNRYSFRKTIYNQNWR